MKYLYVFESCGLHKIGVTDDPGQRLFKLALQAAAAITPVMLFECANAGRVELMLHAAFAAKRRHGEWFELSADDLADVVRCASVAGCVGRTDLVAELLQAAPRHDAKTSAAAVLARFLSQPHTVDESLAILQRIVQDMPLTGLRARCGNRDDSLVIVVDGAERHVGDDGLVRFVTAPMVAAAVPAEQPVPAATAG
jgi:hypothetical protein